MRDIGVLSTASIPQDLLLGVLNDYAAKKNRRVSHSPTESVIGEDRDVLYIRNLPPENNAHYDDIEKRGLELRLGGPVTAYVSIHFGPTDAARKLAVDLAQEITARWGGLLDYSGMGGEVGVPPQHGRV